MLKACDMLLDILLFDLLITSFNWAFNKPKFFIKEKFTCDHNFLNDLSFELLFKLFNSIRTKPIC